MADDLEDGEVIELEDDSEKPSASVSMTDMTTDAAQNTDNNAIWQASSSANGTFANYDFPNGTSQIKFVPKPLRNSDSESDDDSASDTDSPPKPKRIPSASAFSMSTSTLNAGTASLVPEDRRTKTKKKGDLWASVMSEQDLSKGMSGWFGMSSKVDSDRDVETYDYRAAKDDPRPYPDVVGDAAEMNGAAESVSTFDLESSAANIFDREIFGTGYVHAKRDPKAGKSDDKPANGGADAHEKTERKFWRKRTHANAASGAVAAHGRLGMRGFDPEKDRDHIKASVGDDPKVIAVEIMRVLKEPDTMMPTFLKVVEVGGAQKALEMLYSTEDLEAAGGLMTIDGSRRRTAGGVYLYLVKEDTTMTKEQQDEIFRESRDEWRRQQKLNRDQMRERNTRFFKKPAATQSATNAETVVGATSGPAADVVVPLSTPDNVPNTTPMEDGNSEILDDDLPNIWIS